MGYSRYFLLVYFKCYCPDVSQRSSFITEANFKCGNETPPFSAFIRMTSIRTSFSSASSESQRRRLNLIGATPFDAVLSDLDTWRNTTAQDQGRLATRAQLTWDFGATDPGDKIYALLGLRSDSDTHFIVPDYEISVAELYTSVTRHFISRGGMSLMPHQHNDGSADSSRDLPSWVPDYSDTRARDRYVTNSRALMESKC
jgi:hypothetical protein